MFSFSQLSGILGVFRRFPPGTILPPFPPKTHSPPAPPLSPSVVVSISPRSIAFGLIGAVVVGMFGIVSYLVCCLRMQVRQVVAGAATKNGGLNSQIATSVPVARIGRDGKASIVQGVLLSSNEGQMKGLKAERQALLSGVTGF